MMEQCQSDREQAHRIAVKTEQDYISRLYARLDALRDTASDALRETYAQGGGGGYAERMDREATASDRLGRLVQLSSVDNGLCFGRIDHREVDGVIGETHYIGRIGLRDENHDPMLIDWRAPAARPFYAATPNAPGDLIRRRHLHVRDRTVVGIDDEVFDLDNLSDSDRRSLVGEAALLATLRQARTGRMGDIVATIQAEQDRVIRASLPGALVVQGGPGTGKTVAALHRAAFLLYTHRTILEGRGVLVVGPNSTFLRYIGQVLPSLGESDVVLTTVGELYPGIRASAVDAAETAVVKGSLRIADLVEAAVADRQRVPDGDLEVTTDGATLRVDHDTCAHLRDRARDLGIPHNKARKLFVNEMLWALAHAQDDQLEQSLREVEEAEGLLDHPDLPELEDAEAPLRTEEDTAYARETLWADSTVRTAIDDLWPLLTPERLVGELLSEPARLESAVLGAAALNADSEFSTQEWHTLLRSPDAPWTTGDIPLLDEAAELLGEDDSAEKARERAEEQRRHEEERYAQGVLEFTGLFEDQMMDMTTLAQRHQDTGPTRTTAERAAADRTWAYGHVIVDEAQELSEMAWRVVMRRVPTKSLTVVGDLAQTGSAAGARSWHAMLRPYIHDRLHEERLLVNYRTPAEIMEVAADVLAEVAPDQEPPESAREGESVPRAVRVDPGALESELGTLVDAELSAIGEGSLAVITPAARHAATARWLPDATAEATPDVLDRRVAVLTPTQAKGLEFDAVVTVDPDGILAASPTGGHDLYVAITRATRRLTVVHEGELPAMLSKLRPADAAEAADASP